MGISEVNTNYTIFISGKSSFLDTSMAAIMDRTNPHPTEYTDREKTDSGSMNHATTQWFHGNVKMEDFHHVHHLQTCELGRQNYFQWQKRKKTVLVIGHFQDT
jgi:hypothetical protein